MDTAKLSDQPIEQILAQFDEVGASSGPTAPAAAALAARLTVELTKGLHELSDMIFTAKRQMVDRMDALTVEIKSAQASMDRSTHEASEQTKGLVKWTKALVFVTIAYTVITGGLLVAALLHKA